MLKKLLALALLWPLAAHAALSIEGAQGAVWTTGTTIVFPAITTTGSNEPIIVFVANNGSGVNTVTSTHLTFTQRTSAASPAIEEWTATASAPLTSEVVTVTFASTPSYGSANIFGVLGSPSSSYFDTNASIPVHNNTAADPTFSTSAANTIVFAGMRFNSTGTPTAGTGWTLLYAPSGGYFLSEYKVFSSAQTSTTVAVGTGTADENGSLVDAIIQATTGCTNSGFTSAGAIAVPTSGTTVMRLKSGALGSVDCSSIQYKQTLGVFGVN